ncbi:MAG: DNA polymerase III subunit gamma/tau [Deltaproteobacteria bacterium]|nr:DNA polymerase III subunit gamma/tau [Deltaproteobacteria bacterium]
MSYLVLARKYRPQTFADVVKQNHVTQTLSHAISSGRVAHAILFTGPRGTGKTTIARILAKALNCQQGPTVSPCNVCRSCMEITSGQAVDVFEIDGASNNSVDQVRDLRDNVRYMPSHSRYKIYIIDEVHMLSAAAFNALLKTLEEPPAHVLFMFATTEPQKIPLTILSRCQRHDLRRIDTRSILEHLQSLCTKEAVDIPPESLLIVSQEAGGSMRDALSLLDQILSFSEGKITHELVISLLGVIDRQFIYDFSQAVLNGDITEILNLLETGYENGLDLKRLYSSIVEHFRNLLVVKICKNAQQLVDVPLHEIDRMQQQVKSVSVSSLNHIFDMLFSEEATLRYASLPRIALELVFFRIIQTRPALPIDDLIEKLDLLRKEIHHPSQHLLVEEHRPYAVPEPGPEPEQILPRPEPLASVHSQPPEKSPQQPLRIEALESEAALDAALKRIVDKVSETSPALAPVLSRSKLKKIENHTLEIHFFGNGFNLNRIRQPKNEALLKSVINQLFERPIKLIIQAEKEPLPENQVRASQTQYLRQEALNHPLVADVIEIFGGTVVDIKIEKENPS